MADLDLETIRRLVDPKAGVWAPAASQHRATQASPGARSGLRHSVSVNWRSRPELLCALACIAIWIVTFYAIGRL